ANVPRPGFLAAALEIHVAGVGFNAEHQPVPLEIVTDLAAGNYARLTVTPFLSIPISMGPIEIDVVVLAVTELATDVETDIKTGPVALGRRRRCDLFHFLSARQCLRAGQNGQRQRGAGTK